MAMNHEQYALAHGLKLTPATLTQLIRIRSAAAYLRSRSRKRCGFYGDEPVDDLRWLREAREIECWEAKRMQLV